MKDVNRDAAAEEGARNQAPDGPQEQSGAAAGEVEQPDKLQRELADYKDRYVRLYAEFDNARKRQEREKMEFVRYANEQLIAEFLAILDNLELSLNAAKHKHEDYTAFIKGIEMVMTHIYGMLKKNGVRPVETDGRKFDPNCHEVLMQEPHNDVEEGAILEVFQKGYYFHDKVIRTAKVKLAVQGPADLPEEGGPVKDETAENI
jgi:molecular chaperone GrpE